MPLDTNLLYGVSVASGVLHLAVPFGLQLLVAQMGRNPWILFALTVVASFLIYVGVFTGLQASACDGVKSWQTVFGGAAIGTAVVAAMATIPLLFEPARLVVSQLAGKHLPILNPGEEELYRKVAETSLQSIGDTTTDPAIAALKMGLPADKFAEQTFQETWMGMSYWAAFGGLYGVGLGSLVAAACPATA
jgi:hypothetical protein